MQSDKLLTAMKSLLYSAIIILGLGSCSQPSTDYDDFANKYRPYHNQDARVTGRTGVPHVAIAGQAVEAPLQSRTDAAFNQYANDYRDDTAPTAHNTLQPAPIDLLQANGLSPYPIENGSLEANKGGFMVTHPVVAPDNRLVLPPLVDNSTKLLAQPSNDENQGRMDYIVKITNGTNGRIFVEAHDARDTIYPCGFMQKGQSFSTPLKNVLPIKGPIVIVVRDPDQPNAPELRRYRVYPPKTSYKSRTLSIKLIAGGRYQASIDGQVYFENDPNL